MLEIYLIRHGEIDPDGTANSPLSERGHAQAKAVGKKCRGWGVQLLCVSTMLRAQQTAEEILAMTSIKHLLHLAGLEEVNITNPEWKRVVDALTYICTFAEARNLDRVAIVAHGGTIMASLLHWLGLGPQAVNSIRFGFSNCSTTKVVLGRGVPVRVEWVNCLHRGRNV